MITDSRHPSMILLWMWLCSSSNPETDGVYFFTSNLGWPWDVLWPTECGKSDIGQILERSERWGVVQGGHGEKGQAVSGSLEMLPWACHIRKSSSLQVRGEKMHGELRCPSQQTIPAARHVGGTILDFPALKPKRNQLKNCAADLQNHEKLCHCSFKPLSGYMAKAYWDKCYSNSQSFCFFTVTRENNNNSFHDCEWGLISVKYVKVYK